MTYDRKACVKVGGQVEAFLEYEAVKEEVQKVQHAVKNEAAEKAAEAENQMNEEDGEEKDPETQQLALLRRPPAQQPEGSESYWRSVANVHVRTYVTLLTEPATLDGVVTAVAGGPLREETGESGKSTIAIVLDCDLLGESQGPSSQPLLRKKFVPDQNLVRKLLHGAMIGRGSQKKESGEATVPASQDLVILQCGADKFGKEAESYFKVSSSRKDASIDCEHKEVLVVLSDQSVRGRKQRVKGTYSLRTSLHLFSSEPLATMVPERQFPDFSGHNTSDLFATVSVLQPEDMWHLNRPGCLTKKDLFRCFVDKVPTDASSIGKTKKKCLLGEP